MDTKQVMVNFTPAKLAALRRAYGRAVAEREAEFVFEGRQMLTQYAGYLVKYLTREFAQMEIVV